MRFVLLLPMLVAGISLLASTESRADETPAKLGVPTSDWHTNVGLGAFDGPPLGNGLATSIFSGYRYEFVEAGALLDWGTTVLAGSYVMPGLALGLAHRLDAGVRLELLGVAGVDRYMGLDCGLFCRSGGAYATLPWLGARAAASYIFLRNSRGHVELGLAVTMGDDARHTKVTYTNVMDHLFDEGTYTETKTIKLGGLRTAGMLTLGGAMDLGL